MKIELKEKPKGVTIVEGFPGFGFVSTIAVEYLVDHLKVRSIGKIWSTDIAPLAIIHKRKVVQPLEIFYDEKHNLVILEALAGVAGLEWEVAEALIFLYKELKAKELVSIEGIGSPVPREAPRAYYHTTTEKNKELLEATGAKPLREGIIFGVSGALMLKLPKNINASFIFAETHSKLPDSRAAAKIVEILDKYLDLKVDYKPLLKRAAEFEEKLKELIEKSRKATLIKKKREVTTPYIG